MTAFVYGISGIIAQLVIVPMIMLALNKTGLVRMYGFQKKEAEQHVEQR